MSDPLDHVAPHELALFAINEEPNAARFRSVRLHLQTGCRSCAEIVAEGFRRPGDPRSRVPPSAVPPEEWFEPKAVVSQVAVRVGALADLQFICGIGQYELDVLVRQREAPQRLDIGGQITRLGAIHQPVARLPLTLIEAQDAKVLESTQTDEFGEFAFPTEPEGHYGLRVGSDAKSPCVLLWEGTS